MKIIFIRHGEPNYEMDCLTLNGKLQAQCTAQRLSHENIQAIYASPLGRAQETAQYTAQALSLPICTLPFMQEIKWSPALPYHGHPWMLASKLMEEGFTLTQDNWKMHPYFSTNLVTQAYDEISEKFDTFLSQQGYQREGIRYYCTTSEEKTLALFSHGGSGACALSHLLNIPLPYVFAAMPYDFTSVTILTLQSMEGKYVFPQITLFNDTEHVKSMLKKQPVFQR